VLGPACSCAIISSEQDFIHEVTRVVCGPEKGCVSAVLNNNVLAVLV
jgi:hypothetical protein